MAHEGTAIRRENSSSSEGARRGLRTNSIGLALAVCVALSVFMDCSGEGGAMETIDVQGAPLAIAPSAGVKDFIAFESGPVRPLALSPDRNTLFATNTPDNHLEIYGIDVNGNLTHKGSVRVGLEPVAVAARSNSEVWVVNHLSDSVSVVDVSGTPRVKRTLLVGDEPRDIVFAANGRAFITTAHRGQQRSAASIATVAGAGDPRLSTPGMPRADIWVFDSANLGGTLGGTPLKIVELFGDTPRALATSPAGNVVYAAIFNSGNQTVPVQAGVVCDNDFQPHTPCEIEGVVYPGGDFGPSTNYAGAPAPHVSLIVKYDEATRKWRDLIGRDWSNAIRFNLPDKDVFAIDASTLNEIANYPHVGTTLFSMVTNPVTGAVYVSNTDSQNAERFEGPGTYAGRTVQGNLAHTRITVIKNGSVLPRHLNKHIDYSVRPAPASTNQHSLATPLDMVVTSNGSTLYVAAYGSSKIGVYDTTALEADTFNPVSVSSNHIPVSGGGPAGIVLNEAKGRLYVLTRFDNSISVINTSSKTETAHLHMHNPEPKKIVDGRRFLYDAALSSSNGETSCASCHIFGDKDELSWDLGNPDEDVKTTPYAITLIEGATPWIQIDAELNLLKPRHLNGTDNPSDLHPMKGPMTTQTLRGLPMNGAMHWRGDRADGVFGRDIRTARPFDARLSFRNFIVAYSGLLGRSALIDESDMNSFADFALELVMPPNPVRNLDNSLTASQQRGMRFFMGCDGADSLLFYPVFCGLDNRPVGVGHFADGFYLLGIGRTCEGCHTLEPEDGFFGTEGSMSLTLLPQISKVPQLRNAYTKVGMFGAPAHGHQNPFENHHQGDQVRGTGFMSSGSVDTLRRFFNGKVFNARGPFGAVGFSGSDPSLQRADVEQFVLAFPSDLAPVVGQQVTLTSSNSAVANPRIDLLVKRASTPFASKILGTGVNECELTAFGVIGGVQKNWLYRALSATFEPDDGSLPISLSNLRALANSAGQEITFTCVPPGSGVRVALDRDRDGYVNGRDACPDDSGCSAACGSGTLDCDQFPLRCEQYSSSNLNHYGAGRATRGQGCSVAEYFAKGSGTALGVAEAVTTLYTTDEGAVYRAGECPVRCEVNGTIDVNHCGACGNVCSFPNAAASCSAGACKMGACTSGFTDCNGIAEDGCEAELRIDPDNCGRCGNACGYAHISGQCLSGTCWIGGACDTGFANCNGLQLDGCEVDVQNDRRNCGRCGNTCAFANAGFDCRAGVCVMGACLPGFSNCDGSFANGCETPSKTCN